ncbi:hypothetical protein V6N13_104859 [Hibiscus sabdariffa]
MSTFLWGGVSDKSNIHWVKWSQVCSSKLLGGLGVSNLDTMSRALLSKWLWRYDNESSCLWRRVLAARSSCCSSDHLIPIDVKTICVPCWVCPPKSFLKVNVDGVVSRLSSWGGIGSLLRDESGSTLLSFSKCVGVNAPALVELEVILVGIHKFIASD